MIVKIARYFDYPDLKRQTPENKLIWDGIIFTEENILECDYLVVLEYPREDFSIKVSRKNIIHVSMEPPNEISTYRQYANKKSKIIYNQLDIKKNNKLSQGALPWYIDKDFDFLDNLKATQLIKNNKIVWVTSNNKSSIGHNFRMKFLNNINDLHFMDIYGRGIKPIDNKWGVLSKTKYAIAYENYQADYYWTEKIADCFLSYTMPLYFGCKNISDYFPKESFIQIDPRDKHIKLFLKEIVESKKWEDSLDAISEARNLVLHKYQLFPFLSNEIRNIEAKNSQSINKEIIFLKGQDHYFDNYPIKIAWKKNINKFIKKVKGLNYEH